MAVPRYAEKFTSSDGSTIVYTFPLNLYEWDSGDQNLSNSMAVLTGSHYDYDQLGTSLAIKRNAVENVRFILKGTAAEIENAATEARQECYRAGRGKLWVLDSTGDRWWAWARAANIPSIRLNNPFTMPMSIPFIRLSDWFNDTQAGTSVTMNEATETFSIDNTGNARVYNAIFTLSGTFVNPRIANLTNSYVMQSTRDGSSADHRLRFDAGKRRVEWSTNAGSTYTGDYANVVRQAGQVGLMVLEPGVNSFEATFGAVPSGSLAYTFYPAYH